MRTAIFVPDPAIVALEGIVADAVGVALVLRAPPDRLLHPPLN